MNILIVEDEEAIREVEAAYLKNAGFTVMEAESGDEALEILKSEKIGLVLLDLNLPGKDGINVCKHIRYHSTIPIIMVTARAEDVDELSGLEVGADDYIRKPFNPAIIVARVKAILKRIDSGKISVANINIDPDKLEVTVDGNKVKLTVTEFNILHLLASNLGKVFSREKIMDKAYHSTLPMDVFDRTIDVHVKNLRKKLKDFSDKDYILTVIGSGYKFNEDLNVS